MVMGALASLRDHRIEILRLAESFGAGDVRVFGSTARGDDGEDSDIDLLVTWSETASLVDWVGFQQEVERLLGRHVDVVSERSLHWSIRDKILAEARPLP
jgi:predicted nucleotidyltransferase